MFTEAIASLMGRATAYKKVEHGLDNEARDTRRYYYWLPVVSALGNKITESQAETLAQKLHGEVKEDRIRPAAEVFAEIPDFRRVNWGNPVLRKVSFGFTKEEMEFKLASLIIPRDPEVVPTYLGLVDLIDDSPYRFIGGEGPKRAVINDLLCLEWARLVDRFSQPELSFSLNRMGKDWLKAMEIVFNGESIKNDPRILRAERYRVVIF